MKRWKALAGVAAVAALLLTPLVATSAYATQPQAEQDADKVFVCKYVGTPGEGERLQTGNNPINPSIDSIKGNFPDGHVIVPGDTFSDQHGRSVVLALDTGQVDPPRSACQTQTTTPEDASGDVIVTPPDCGVGGTVNLDPTSHNSTIDYFDDNPGMHVATFTAVAGHLFPGGGTTKQVSYTILPALQYQSTDAEARCYTRPPVLATATIDVTVPSCADLNGSAELAYAGATVTSATLNGVPVANFADLVSASYPDPAAGHWTITLTANAGFTFGDSATKVLTFDVPEPIDADCVVTAVFDVVPTPPTCGVDGSLPSFITDRNGYTLSIAPSFDGPGEYVLTATADPGLTFTGGGTVRTKDITVKPALAFQSVDDDADCFLDDEPNPSPSESFSPSPSVTGTPVVTDSTPGATPDPTSSATPAGLAATGGADMTPLGVGAALVLIAGLALLVTRRALAKH